VPYPMATPEDLAVTVKQVQALGRRIVAAQADVRDFGHLRPPWTAAWPRSGRRGTQTSTPVTLTGGHSPAGCCAAAICRSLRSEQGDPDLLREHVPSRSQLDAMLRIRAGELIDIAFPLQAAVARWRGSR
jgi:hypothetical protein